MKSKSKRSALTLGAVIGLSLAASPAVMANPFQASSLRNGNLLAENTAATKPADGKCGAKMMKDGKCGAKGMSASKPTSMPASMPGKMMKDGKCGQGTCGSKKK